MADDSRTGTFVKVAAVLLIAVVAAGAVGQLMAGGVAAAPSALVSLYVVAVVGFGIFRGEMDTRRFRVAFYLGVAAWGALRVWEGDGLWALALFALGAALLVREVYAS